MGRNYEELRLKILGRYGQLSPFAKALGIQPSTLSLKLQGATDWKREEIEKTAQLLDLTANEVWLIFFA
jgi:hypothetical protein